MSADEKLKTVLGAILDLPPEAIGPDTSMDTVPKWDSVKHMHLVVALEEAFSISIPDDEVVTMTSFPIIKLVIEEQLGKS